MKAEARRECVLSASRQGHGQEKKRKDMIGLLVRTKVQEQNRMGK